MLIVGYVLAIRSGRMICREVQVNLAYRVVLQARDRERYPGSFGVLWRPQRALHARRCIFRRSGHSECHSLVSEY